MARLRVAPLCAALLALVLVLPSGHAGVLERPLERLRAAACPFLGAAKPPPPAPHVPGFGPRQDPTFNQDAVENLDVDAVKADLRELLVSSKTFWPSDYGHYGGLFIRQAWHCAGSFRTSDGRGGCNGARQRFDPERSWADNTNLDKAKLLLLPLKQKYGSALSWGDLIVLAGDTAIESMGGPVLGFCAGRIDDIDGADSLPLGPTPEQERLAPCEDDGDCKAPLGPSTMQLIYVNPEGVKGDPTPEKSVPLIRDTFARMAMNDSETVALIGGGHAFGKTHGPCMTGPGPSPAQQPSDPWPGTCGSGADMGKGANAWTSGFEGPWTTTPTQWDNQYFKNLLDYKWDKVKSPAGHWQWEPVAHTDPARNGQPLPKIMMLTTDIALTNDPAYLGLVKAFAADQAALDRAFSHAWYKLMTRDMGPHSRCLGRLVPPPQDFQQPLPPPPADPPSPDHVRADIVRALTAADVAGAEPDYVGGEGEGGASGQQGGLELGRGRRRPHYGAQFVALAWGCAASFQETSLHGGCNGARIRHSPMKDWPQNAGLDRVLAALEPVKQKYGDRLSYADLIVLAGGTALEEAGGPRLPFCPGRADAPPGHAWEHGVASLIGRDDYTDAIVEFRDRAAVRGLTPRQAVALAGLPRSAALQRARGYSGAWGGRPDRLSAQYYDLLLSLEWTEGTSAAGKKEYASPDGARWMTPGDLAVRWDPELAAAAQAFAADEAAWHAELAGAWTYLMNADRFAGPARSACA